MPSQSHPQAQFVPISPDFNLDTLVKNATNFDYVTRLSTDQLKEHSMQDFEALVLAVVIQSGKPLVIEDWGANLPPWLFSRDWLEKHLGTHPESVRDITNTSNIPMTMGHYLRSMSQLTNQFSASNYRDPKRQRLYLKDIDCPEEWAQHLSSEIPELVYYLNDSIESRTGGDGAIREPNEYGQMRYGKGVAPAGDLMSSLPPEMRALNMMCYIGHEGTYTPAHREMCASLGQNIMVEASGGRNGEKPGSSIWFMTETKEREVVSEYFLSMLGHDIEVEKHFAQTNAWKKAPFNVYVVEQKVGDLILIPPLAPHQVWNRGTRTMKVAWNRTTVDTLELAMHEALPRARMVCRDEQYKNKAIIYYTLEKYHDLLQRETIEPKMWKYGRIKQLLDDFRRLFELYKEILVSEMFSSRLPEEADVEFLEYDSNVTCSYCRGNIFNRFLTCKSCVEYGPGGEEDTYDICMDCYAMGRSCACISNLSWVEQWKWSKLVQNYEQWRNIVVQADGFFDKFRSPQPLESARKMYGRKPIAEVCQEQLRTRPWNDIKNPTMREPSPGMSDIEPEVDDNGRPKNKKRGKFSKAAKGRVIPTKNMTQACHICCHHDWNWRLAFCTSCKNAYCYGTLWRAFDLMPQAVMEDREWQCPKCLKFCSCGKCRKSDTQTPYAPKGTLLGHDTRLIADFRSVESLVDFSRTNLSWLRDEADENPQESQRMIKLKERAEADKARVEPVKEGYVEDGGQEDPSVSAGEQNGIDTHENMDDIDPALRDTAGSTTRANGGCASLSAPSHPTTEGELANHINGDGLNQSENDWLMDPHYDLDEYNRSSLNYPSILAPDAPMAAPEAPMMASTATDSNSYPDPSYLGQSRMMGIGYYQQGNGADKIVYDAPDSNENVNPITQSSLSQNINPNMALSDLMPLPPPPEVPDKKRRRNWSEDEDDLEFFTSKKQRLLAKARKTVEKGGVVASEVTPTLKPPKRAMIPKIYTDLGEAAVPIEDDEAPTLTKRICQKPATPAELAARAMRRLEKEKAKGKDQENSQTPRRSLRANHEISPVASASPKNQPRRKSAWLARKEAEENGEECSAPDTGSRKSRGRGRPRKSVNLSSNSNTDQEESDDNDEDSEFQAYPQAGRRRGRGRGRPKKNARASKLQTQIMSDESEDEGGVGLEVDSIFGESLEQESIADVEPVSTFNAISAKQQDIDWDDFEDHPGAKVGQLNNGVASATKRGRGRPKAHHSPSPALVAKVILPKLFQASTKMLSLKEKLALKGKAVKIVASKSRTSISKVPRVIKESHASSADQTVIRSPSPVGSNEWNDDPKSATTLSSAAPGLSDGNKTALSQTPAAPPKPAAPTVVRLNGPSNDDISDTSMPAEPSDVDSDSDSDESIPAVRATPKPNLGGPALSRGHGRGSGRA
ncbi:hypothetical protein BJ875DRAFT_456568 [Amylocarpus encephaloides]|uniref:JmjC domain-containing protein n=1 Tax=Amylocarpus encephaloides TaxID=45428 RepID=A0A9P7YMN3_9HELO|nr:hypothetical protein BJ875DRAFT_456568 [Amylocarpus encephaloides]